MAAETTGNPSRDELASQYLDQLLYTPYRMQEEALLAWFTTDDGVLVCAPTGMGKTLIAEAAMFEALHTRKVAYYTTPLIALTEQKFQELQAAAERWGFSRDDVGLVTGNRRVNPDARCLVVVAEILLNRLLHGEEFDFSHVSSVVMDEFHSFNDPERGIVWELSLALLPRHVRLMLLSATVGNTAEFQVWLHRSHGRRPQLVQSTERKVPLQFEWVGERLLNEQLERMSEGEEPDRRTPALLFCFNRSECWNVAEQLKGKSLLAEGQQKQLAEVIDKWDWNRGIGPKLRPLLMRGVAVHHAGLLPRYRRRVEELFQKKLLSVCVCTETLAAGINLPARSVVLTTLVKGPPGKKKLIDSSTAHQIFGRAGRPQFDKVGYVFSLAHEDDVKIARWKRQYDQIPENTKDPNLIRAKKNLKRKAPTRRSTEQYWNEDQFRKLIAAPPGKLASRGELPWRLLAYLLQISPDVDRLRDFVRRRMLEPKWLEQAQKRLDRMLLALWAGRFVELEPVPPIARPERHAAVGNPGIVRRTRQSVSDDDEEDEFGGGLLDDAVAPVAAARETPPEKEQRSDEQPPPSDARVGLFGTLLQEALAEATETTRPPPGTAAPAETTPEDALASYVPHRALPTGTMSQLLLFRSVNPMYAIFLLGHLGRADQAERIQALESVLELPGSLLPQVRVPQPDVLPPGPLAQGYLDSELLSRGLATAEELNPSPEDVDRRGMFRERRFAMPLADKLRLLFLSEFPDVRDFRITPVWVVGDLLQFGGDFDKYVRGRDLTKQEGLIFRHLLRMILLCGEFAQLAPPELDPADWQRELRELAEQLTVTCRGVDPESTDKVLESMQQGPDLVAGEGQTT